MAAGGRKAGGDWSWSAVRGEDGLDGEVTLGDGFSFFVFNSQVPGQALLFSTFGGPRGAAAAVEDTELLIVAREDGDDLVVVQAIDPDGASSDIGLTDPSLAEIRDALDLLL